MPEYSTIYITLAILMPLPDFSQLFENKALLSALSAVGGGLIGNLIAVLRSRVKTMEYTVHHDRVGFSADDQVFGAIRVTWQNHDVTNLFSSRVTLENQTGKDFTNIKVKVYTGDTLLLGERTEIPGTTYILKWTDDFQQQLRVLPGDVPSEQQFNTYNHSREYVVPVLNRGQRVVMTYLTTVPAGGQGPAIWLDMLHEGVKVQHRQVVPQVHGVPIRLAISVGLVVCVAVLAVASVAFTEPWAAAAVCMTFGLFAQSIGAFVYRGLRLLKALVVR
ncbi:MAG: hypothetical protein A2496_14200 [Burkholderiales bacterium RIFOXYC12_FULL_60_6]|nr:MAG: hypothetical protein A2496_14200 [Burkholderiales bacterium RIFOXYC12_FULL_60_6]